MAKDKSTSNTSSSGSRHVFLFAKKNYIIMGVGFLIILLGMLLMIGGGSPNPEIFDKDAIYSFRRITLAPIVIMIGFGLQIYAIWTKTKPQ